MVRFGFDILVFDIVAVRAVIHFAAEARPTGLVQRLPRRRGAIAVRAAVIVIAEFVFKAFAFDFADRLVVRLVAEPRLHAVPAVLRRLALPGVRDGQTAAAVPRVAQPRARQHLVHVAVAAPPSAPVLAVLDRAAPHRRPLLLAPQPLRRAPPVRRLQRAPARADAAASVLRHVLQPRQVDLADDRLRRRVRRALGVARGARLQRRHVQRPVDHHVVVVVGGGRRRRVLAAVGVRRQQLLRRDGVLLRLCVVVRDLLRVLRVVDDDHLALALGAALALAPEREQLPQRHVLILITFRFVHFLIVFEFGVVALV